jgi:chemotaxis regulatin CheY-phosphate phosphatase CheZ
MRRHHDMGGLTAGPVDSTPHDVAPWEKRVDAILRLLIDSQRRVMTVDQLRRGIEDLGPDAYDRLDYYQRWISSIANILMEQGTIGVDELGRRMAEVEARWLKAGRKRREAGP